jgi:polyisoprenoid-binding protein YceI
MYQLIATLILVFGWPSASLAEDVWSFSIQPTESRFTVKVGKAGFLKAFGHEHLIEIHGIVGDIDWRPDSPEMSSIRIEIDANSLVVIDEGISDADKATVQAEMETTALDVTNYPKIVFVSKELSVSRGDGERKGNLKGELTLRGVTDEVKILLTLTVGEQELRAQGVFKIKGSDFGVPQIKAAGGSVKTKDELDLTFDLVARRK